MSEHGLTGYPSIDKPWLQYYSEEAIHGKLPEYTMYGYVYEKNKNRQDATALEYFGRKISYRELFLNVQRTAEAFYARGIRKGDMVTIMSLITPETIYCIYALNYIGAVANMVYLSLSEDEMVQMVEKTDSKMFIILEIVGDRIEKVQDRLRNCEIIRLDVDDSMPFWVKIIYRINRNFRSNKNSYKIERYTTFVEKTIMELAEEKEHNQSGLIEAPYKKNMPALIVYTSGTTGEPKGVILTNDNFNAISYQYLNSGIEFEQEDSIMTFMPPFLSIGFSLNIHMPLCLGLKSVICVNPEPNNIVRFYIKNRPNHFVAAPLNVLQIMEKNGRSMKYCKSIGGGEAMSAQDTKKVNFALKKWGSNARYITGYGMSEFAATVTLNIVQAYQIEGMGIPLCKTVVKIVDPDTLEELSYNRVGEMCFHTPSQMLGYLDNEEATEKTMRIHKDGMVWVHTGDLGCVDKNGVVYFKGRIKRIYMTKGEDGTIYKIFPARVEELLGKYPGVRKCAVAVTAAREVMHEQTVFLTLKDKTVDQEKLLKGIQNYCRENLPSHAIPVRYIVLDSIPLTQSGKVDYRKLESAVQEMR